ncbi:MAG TPA: polyphosphate kinase 1 [Candidatus Acidoferrum sp.]|nr:polyphosphate kinase 1 [Candidatus Acidoferrum sp.]
MIKGKKSRGKEPLTKETSWLDFNGRVLEEAADSTVPLLERFKFLGIYSNNLDEFFRVRVATLNRLAKAPRKKAIHVIGYDPPQTLKRVQREVVVQRDRFDRIYSQLLRELAHRHIYITDEKHLTTVQTRFVADYFQRIVRPQLFPIMIDHTERFPELTDRSVYLAVTLIRERSRDSDYALIEVPTDVLPRFVLLPQAGQNTYIIMLDDVIRFNLDAVFAPFGYKRFMAHTVKVTRDAELDIDDDIFESYVRKLRKSLRQRREGRPVRLIYDAQIPQELLRLLVKRLNLRKGDPLIAGSRYHNFKDFMKFPSVGSAQLRYPQVSPVPHRDLRGRKSILTAIQKRDILFHFPYQSFDSIIDLLREASIDPHVRSIKITLYRTAPNSSVVNALMNAVKNGKSVVAVVELQARFDEEANIRWATELQAAGAKVVFGVQGLKVHSKICLITRKNGRGTERFAIIATGNFNEETSRVYTDHFLLTANPKIAVQVSDMFEFLEKNYKVAPFRHLLVSPFNCRRRLSQLIQTEIENAKKGEESWILLKLNHLVDTQMIKMLYKASQSGVKIRLIVRGMFTLDPGVPGQSENIEAIRLVDRYLEHSRILFFADGGAARCFLSSADWMPRNLDRRVEVTCPVLDETLKRELRDVLELQWRDGVKAAAYGPSGASSRPGGVGHHRAQTEIAAYLRDKNR